LCNTSNQTDVFTCVCKIEQYTLYGTDADDACGEVIASTDDFCSLGDTGQFGALFGDATNDLLR
jgi:hypothetical protein